MNRTVPLKIPFGCTVHTIVVPVTTPTAVFSRGSVKDVLVGVDRRKMVDKLLVTAIDRFDPDDAVGFQDHDFGFAPNPVVQDWVDADSTTVRPEGVSVISPSHA